MSSVAADNTSSSSTMENVVIDMPPPQPPLQQPPRFTDLHVQQVSSALHNEGGRCMSIGGVEQMFWGSAQPVSRSTASQLLEHIATSSATAASSSSNNSKYQATYCRWSESSNSDGNADDKATRVVPCTTFKLYTEDFNAEQKKQADDDETTQVLYALSVSPSSSHAMAESLSTAHERDMAQLRDRLLAVISNNAERDAMWDCTIAQDVLCSAKELAMSSTTSSRNYSNDVDMLDNDAVTSSQVAATAGGGVQNKRLPPVNNNSKKKAVTAKSFFAANNNKTVSSTIATAAASKKATAKSSTAATTSTTSSKKQADGKKAPSSKQQQPVSSSTNKFFKTQEPRGPAEEKENNMSKKESKKHAISKKPVGTADDFIGDMDDDDEDSDVGDDASDVDLAKAEIRGRDKPPSRGGSQDDPMQVDDVNDDDDDSGIQIAPVEGAMDAFVKTAAPDASSSSSHGVAGTKQKRRRKRLVEKTTVDASGYLHTETQEVWEDVPSDEEDERQKAVAATAAAKKKKTATTITMTTSNAGKKKKATKPSAMKQGSLVGFFKKK